MREQPAVKSYSLGNFHPALVRECFGADTPLDLAMILFMVLHSCRIRLRHPVIAHHPDLLVLDPITTRDCAEALASIWRDKPGSRFTDEFFYRHWNSEWRGYPRLEEVSLSDSEMALEVKRVLESHPAVAEIIPDDWDPFVPNLGTPPE